MSHALHLTKYSLRAFRRNRRARIFSLAMPVGLLILFDALFGSSAHTTVAGVRVSLANYYVPSIIVLALTTNAFAALVGSVVSQRETGIYKRRRATPAAPWALIASQTMTVLATAAMTTAVLILIAAIGFGIHLPAAGWPALIAGVALGAASLCGLGFALATFVDTVETSQPAIQAVLVPLFFISGIWVPSSELPGWLNSLSAVLPIEHISDVLHRAFAPGALSAGPVIADLAVLVAWALAGAAVATWRFSWLPSTAS